MRRELVDIGFSLPGDARVDPTPGQKHDPPIYPPSSVRHWVIHAPHARCVPTGVNADGTHFALMGEGRDRFGGTAHSLAEEIHVLRNGQPALVRNNSADL